MSCLVLLFSPPTFALSLRKGSPTILLDLVIRSPRNALLGPANGSCYPQTPFLTMAVADATEGE